MNYFNISSSKPSKPILIQMNILLIYKKRLPTQHTIEPDIELQKVAENIKIKRIGVFTHLVHHLVKLLDILKCVFMLPR